MDLAVSSVKLQAYIRIKNEALECYMGISKSCGRSHQAQCGTDDQIAPPMPLVRPYKFRNLVPHHICTYIKHSYVGIYKNESTQREQNLAISIQGRREKII